MVVLSSKLFKTFARFKALFADKSALKCNVGLKLVEVMRGTPALYRPQFSPPMTSPFLDTQASACRHGECTLVHERSFFFRKNRTGDTESS